MLEGLLDGLNESQKLAVTTTEGPVMVMAGAGSGKTRVLTTRISYIISELGINPYNILAVTFTNKAAKEMKDRIAKMLDIDPKWMWVSTFHSFCVRILRNEIEYLKDYKQNFQIIDDEDGVKIVRDIIKDCELEGKPKEVLKYISMEKNGMDFKIRDPEISTAFSIVKPKYNQYLKDNNLFDFDDLIIKTIELFKYNPVVLEKYQDKFQYILVDEFQDTNTLQYDLMFMLAQRHHNLFVVGDDFQSIYSFRGARIENINRLRNDFLETKLILLEKNYRSTTEILNLANNVIDKNPNQIKKVLKSNDQNGDMPVYYHAASSYDEVMFVIERIKKFVALGDNYSDCAILYRANAISREFEDALIKNHIPYQIYGGMSFYSRKEIKDMIAYLRLIIFPDDDYSFRRIVNEPKRKIGPSIIAKLEEISFKNGISLFEAIKLYEGKGKSAENLFDFMNVIKSISEQVENVRLPDLIDIILDNTGYKEMYNTNNEEDLDRLDNIKEFKSSLYEAEDDYEGSNKEKLGLLLQDLALKTNKEEMENSDVVRLSTFHQVKGLEFKNVFMVALENGIFPSYMINMMDRKEIEEERRICYVGITRAKKRLFLTNSSYRLRFGKLEDLSTSMFITEMNPNLYENYNKGFAKPSLGKPVEVKKEETKSSPNMFKAGDKINHKAFGNGIVVSTDGDNIKVAFSAEFGIKTLRANHPSIRKI